MSRSAGKPPGYVGDVESLPGSDASAIPVDHDDPRAAAGPLRPAPDDVSASDEQQVPLIHEDPTAAAFFDLDNTVVQGASLFHFAKGLYRRGFFPPRVILKGLWLQAYFRVVGREKPGHIQDVRSVTLGFIEGHTVTELTEIMESYRPELSGSGYAREASNLLLVQPPFAGMARAGYHMLAGGAVSTLPAWARVELLVPALPVTERLLMRPLARSAMRALRWALVEPPAELSETS